jgi:hypothetical protein
MFSSRAVFTSALKVVAVQCPTQKPSNLRKPRRKLRKQRAAPHLPAAAFGPKNKDVYTLPSAAHVRAARIELDMPF